MNAITTQTQTTEIEYQHSIDTQTFLAVSTARCIRDKDFELSIWCSTFHDNGNDYKVTLSNGTWFSIKIEVCVRGDEVIVDPMKYFEFWTLGDESIRVELGYDDLGDTSVVENIVNAVHTLDLTNVVMAFHKFKSN